MKLKLLNVILPFFFIELKSILIALIFVVLIETFIVNNFIRQKFGFLFGVLTFANILTTFFGYLLQAVLRLALVVVFDIRSENQIVRGLTGNIGVASKWTPEESTSILISLIISILIALLLSIFFETKIVINAYEGKVDEIKISKGVKYANITSYILLFFWIYFNYRFK